MPGIIITGAGLSHEFFRRIVIICSIKSFLKKENEILIVGIGNTIRGDDGIGAYVCSAIDHLDMKGVQTLIVQQLDTGLIDELLSTDKIVLVDAAVSGEDVRFYLLNDDVGYPISVSHHINANLLASLITKLYGKKLNLMMCAVKGENFDMGQRLSVTAKQNADNAVGLIVNWINNSD